MMIYGVETLHNIQYIMPLSRSLPTTIRTRKSVSRAIVITQTCSAVRRSYATANSLGEARKIPSRKPVTVLSDDGQVPWKDLSRGEAAARTTQQTINFGVVLAGVVGTVCLSIEVR